MLDLKIFAEILGKYGDDLNRPIRGFEIGGRSFDFNRQRALAGVINLSPDSWYAESICTTTEQAVARGLALAGEGADLVDIGAESTLPEAVRVSPAAQIDRIVPVVRELAARQVRVSVESYYPEVLQAAAEAGARVFNLIGMREVGDVLGLAAHYDAAVIFCYVQGETPRDVANFQFAEDMMGEMEAYFARLTAQAEAAGVSRCILDPGLGFYYRNLRDGGLRMNHQLNVFLHTFRLNRLGYPTMNVLPHAPDIFGAEHRRAAEPFFAVLALLAGTHIVRTHEIEAVACIRQVLAAYGDDMP